jgi:hypothetical protein
MRTIRRIAAVAALLALAACAGAAAAAALATRPSERSCVVAWNAPSNQSNRLRLLAAKPVVRLTLRPGVTSRDTWTQGAAPTQGSALPACLLTLVQPGAIRLVTGIWRGGGVSRWSFGRALPTTRPSRPANVRLLRDGRVAKLYRR